MKTINISSELTLFVKYVLLAMLGGLTLPAILWLFTSESVNYSGSLPLFMVRLLTVSFFITTSFLLYKTLFRLQRVEVDAEYVYVTDYFKTARYTFDSIEQIDDEILLIFRVPAIRLKEAGIFGKSIRFWAGSTFEEVSQELPELQRLIMKK